MSLLFNMLSRFVIAFLPRSQMSSNFVAAVTITVILEPKKIKSIPASSFSPSIYYDVMGMDDILVFWVLSFKPAFSLSSFTLIKRFFSYYSLLPLEWYHLYIWGCWYFSWQSWFQLVSHPGQHFAWYTLHLSWISRVTIYILDVFFSQFWTNALSMSGSNYCFLTCIQVFQETGKVICDSHLFMNFPQFVVIHTLGFSLVNEVEVVAFWNSLAFSIIQQMLAIQPLVPLPFLNPAYTHESS